MKHKGVYQCEYINCWEKLEVTKLPPSNAVHSELDMKGISDQEYEHAKQVWNILGKKTIGFYHDTYLKTDASLLVNVLEIFCNTYLKNFKLAPAHFYTSPGLAKQALLKTYSEYFEHEIKRKDCELYLDKFKLELLTDIVVFLLFEKGIQSGITRAVKRYANTNNKYKISLYNHEELIKLLAFLDANNLCVCAMTPKLPTHGFAWEKKVYDFISEKISYLV